VRPWRERLRRAVAGASLRARVMAAAAILVALTCLLTGLSGLPAIDTGELEELIIDAWRCQAPRALADRLKRSR